MKKKVASMAVIWAMAGIAYSQAADLRWIDVSNAVQVREGAYSDLFAAFAGATSTMPSLEEFRQMLENADNEPERSTVIVDVLKQMLGVLYGGNPDEYDALILELADIRGVYLLLTEIDHLLFVNMQNRVTAKQLVDSARRHIQ